MQLARLPSIRLGALEIHPASLEVLWPGGRESLEPKVMEVLVLLAQASGRVVARDELIEQCWDGRIVSEDAIHRVVSNLRKLARRTGSTFQIETIAKVGYRLVMEGGSRSRGPRASDGLLSALPAVRRTYLWVPLAGLALGMAVLAAYVTWTGAGLRVGRTPTVEVDGFEPASRDPAARALAASMGAEVTEALRRFDVRVTALPSGRDGRAPPAGPDFSVRGRVFPTAEGFRITTDLWDPRSDVLVYSFDTLQPRGAAADVSAAIASHVALSLDPSKFTNDMDGKLTPADYTILARANDAVDRWDTAGILDQALKLVQRHPDDGDLWASTAMSYIFAAEAGPVAERPRDLDLARSALRRAHGLSRNSALACIAEQMLENGPSSYAAQEQLLRRALRLNSDQHVADNSLAELMLLVGRTSEGADLAERSVELDPMSHVVVAGNLDDLIRAGDADGASRLLSRERLLWPGDRHPLVAEYQMADFLGGPDEAQAVWDKLPTPLRAAFDTSHRTLMFQAWRSKDPALIRRVDDDCFDDERRGAAEAEDIHCLLTMVRSGDLDAAFRFADLVYPDNRNLYPPNSDQWIIHPPPGLDTTWLFLPAMKPFRDDPRFWDVAVRTGLAGYWLTTGSWPDFCAPQLDRCKRLATAAARAHPAPGSSSPAA